jgi:hypothetical protein
VPTVRTGGTAAAVDDVTLTIRSSKSALSDKPLGPSASIGIEWAAGKTHARSARLRMTNNLQTRARASAGLECARHPNHGCWNRYRLALITTAIKAHLPLSSDNLIFRVADRNGFTARIARRVGTRCNPQ